MNENRKVIAKFLHDLKLVPKGNKKLWEHIMGKISNAFDGKVPSLLSDAEPAIHALMKKKGLLA